MRGIIEGFYGTPWTWEERHLVADALAPAGMDTWVYAPKDDPLHRHRWKELHPDPWIADLATLVERPELTVGYAISPGLSIDPTDHADRVALLTKIEQVLDCGVSLVGLLLDDLPVADGLGLTHGHLTQWLRDALPAEVELFLTPLHYTGTTTTPYLADLVSIVSEDVPIAWTGRLVVNDAITVAEAEARADAMGGRAPLLWDNTPCNDVVMADRLFLGALRGRDPELPSHLSGYLANPMVQAAASVPPLLSAAAWLAGDDPVAAWSAAIGDAAVLAEACDPTWTTRATGAAISGDADAAARLVEFFTSAETCGDGGLGPAVAPWVDAVRSEAGVARVALAVLGEPDAAAAARAAAMLVLFWPPLLRRGDVAVFGGRGGTRPCLGQDAASEWIAADASYVPAASIVDRLVAAAFERVGKGPLR